MVTLAAAAAQAERWTPAHDLSRAWYEVLGLAGPWVLLALLLALVVRALLRHGRYRAASAVDAADRAPVLAALAEAGARTRGRLVAVVVERSDPHLAARWRAAVTALAVGTALLLPHLPWERPWLLLACQAGFFAAGYAAARALPDFLRVFVLEERATAVAEEQALQEFHDQALFEVDGRAGVLLFVSLLEHRAVVLADVGVDAVAEPDAWCATDRALLDGLRRGRPSEGLAAAARLAADVLARHFPAAPARVPDDPTQRLVVRRE
jgi:putative membrane protein